MEEIKPKVTVIIPSLYEVDGKYLKLAVESIRATTDWPIVVVTNGTKNSPDLSHIKGITIHLHSSQQGQCNAVNAGAQAITSSQSDYLMISNADMYYAPGWDKHLKLEGLCFSPNLVEPENNLGSAEPFLKLDAGFDLQEFNKPKVDGFIRAMVARKGKTEDGFNLPFFIKRDVWDTIEGYDVAYDPWGSSSDTDLQMKIELAGVKPQRVRDVLVYHFSNKAGTFDFSNHSERQQLWQHNFDYLREKWGFDRDEAGSNTWYCRNMIMEDKLIYKPEWVGRYATKK